MFCAKIHIEDIIQVLVLSLLASPSLPDKSGQLLDYCFTESFRPQCSANEVILMNSATFGRMRTGRCISEQELIAFGDDPRYLGCSENVLPIMDKRCSGSTTCEVRIYDIADENIQPCFPGLKLYLEASYTCINIANEKRSCAVSIAKTPIHIIDSSAAHRICGTSNQPWILEAPSGQRIKITLLDLTASQSNKGPKPRLHMCDSRGIIMDKGRKRNTSICLSGDHREKELYLAAGNEINIIFNPSELKNNQTDGAQLLLKVEAAGCSDIIPPEDTWLKRNDDKIVIGCYSSRQTWQLRCEGRQWKGVLGNCTHDFLTPKIRAESDVHEEISSSGQVLAIVAICGFTVAICLTVMCIGAVCLRRFYAQTKKHREYKTLNFSIPPGQLENQDQMTHSDVTTDVTDDRVATHHMPTYSIYVSEGCFTSPVPASST